MGRERGRERDRARYNDRGADRNENSDYSKPTYKQPRSTYTNTYQSNTYKSNTLNSTNKSDFRNTLHQSNNRIPLSDHEYSHKYTPTYLELNCQWIFELFKLICGIILISILAISDIASVQKQQVSDNKDVTRLSSIFRPSAVYEYVVVIIALLMSISIPVFYFTRTDIFLGRSNWQKVLFWYNFLMFWVTLPALVLACIMADVSRARKLGNDIMVQTSTRFTSIGGNGRSHSGDGHIVHLRSYLITNAVLLAILMMLFLVHAMCIPCVSEKFQKMKRAGQAPVYERGNKLEEYDEMIPEYIKDEAKRGKTSTEHRKRPIEQDRRGDKTETGVRRYKTSKKTEEQNYSDHETVSEFEDYKTIDSRADTRYDRRQDWK